MHEDSKDRKEQGIIYIQRSAARMDMVTVAEQEAIHAQGCEALCSHLITGAKRSLASLNKMTERIPIIPTWAIFPCVISETLLPESIFRRRSVHR